MARFQRWFLVAACCTAAAAAAAGCGDGQGKAAVTGTVKLDEHPITEGELTFLPKEKGKAPEGARIQDGAYSVRIAPGSYTVQVQATKKVPLDPGEESASGEKDKLV